MINFAHPNLSPSINCGTVSTEGYEVQNLISSNPIHLENGFLAERFISGPVIITVKLICPIDLKHVIIWSKVSNQKSLGFELSVLTSSDNQDFRRIASTLIQHDANGIVFHREGHNAAISTNQQVSYFQKCSFSRNKSCHVTHLRIKIFKFRYVAAVKKLEIWGEPNPVCDRELKKRLSCLWANAISDRPSLPVSFKESSEIATVQLSHFNISSDPIPDEFYDEITHEMMTLPMVLPSGKVVDSQTLKKHEKEEAEWGRPPNDPFTGVVFTTTNKPVISAALKAKIDLFLLQNANKDDLKCIPRQVGFDGLAIENSKVSKLITNTKKRKVNSDGNSSCKSLRIAERKTATYQSYLNCPEARESPTPMCIECLCATNLYQLPCVHLICRSCVLIKSDKKCFKCECAYNLKDIKKIHIW